jgi:hypothetical protein
MKAKTKTAKHPGESTVSDRINELRLELVDEMRLLRQVVEVMIGDFGNTVEDINDKMSNVAQQTHELTAELQRHSAENEVKAIAEYAAIMAAIDGAAKKTGLAETFLAGLLDQLFRKLDGQEMAQLAQLLSTREQFAVAADRLLTQRERFQALLVAYRKLRDEHAELRQDPRLHSESVTFYRS